MILLLLLALILMQSTWPEPPPWLDSTGSLLATVIGLALIWIVSSFYVSYCCRKLRQNPAARRQTLHRFHARQRLYFLAMTGFFVLALYGLGWGNAVSGVLGQDTHALPGTRFVMFSPLLLALVLSWARSYDVERTAHEVEAASRAGDEPAPAEARLAFLGRGAYVGLQVRFNLVLIVPPLAVIFVQEICYWLLPGLGQSKYFLPCFTVCLLIVALLCIPWLLRFFLGLRPLPAGPLRDQLLDTVRRLHFRCGDILFWNTRGTMANAMVTGLVPWGRYVVLTDRLLSELSAEEVEAVLGHEIGHVKHHHLSFYALFLMGSLFVLGTLGQAWEPMLKSWLANYELYAAFPALLGVGTYFFLVFGFLSRNCERQADLYGCRTVSSQAFISALEKVAVLNGIPREKPGWFASWRHPSIAHRVEFLMKIAENPALEPRFQWRVGLVKWGLALGLITLLIVTAWAYGVSW